MMNPTPDTPTLTIYTTPNCPSCRLTRQALDRAGITYEVIDLSGRPDLVEQMRSEGLLQAPILDDGTSRSAGFRPDRIRAIVDAATPERLTARGAQVHVPAQTAEVQAHRGRAL
ncbi:MAG: glutaredoxin family protein [Actinomyces sp.]|nr:glutaredoxin family protein [Actinomyces sp.]